MKQMAAGTFKAQCLAIMDQVLQSGEPVLITKHGKPVAKLVPAENQANDIFGYMTGKAKIVGDIVGQGNSRHPRPDLDGERPKAAVQESPRCHPGGKAEYGGCRRHYHPLGASVVGGEWSHPSCG